MAETKTLDRRTRADDDGSLPRICPFEKLTPKQLDSLAVWYWDDEFFTHEKTLRFTWARLSPDHQERAIAQWGKDQEKEISWQRETDVLNKQYDEYGERLRDTVTRSFLTRSLEIVTMGFGKALRAYTDKRVAELREEIEGRLAIMPHDAGVHERGKEYRRGALVTHHGSVFVARVTTSAPIGGDPPSTDWRLFCQRGRDAR